MFIIPSCDATPRGKDEVEVSARMRIFIYSFFFL